MSHRNPDGLADVQLWRTFLAVHRSGSLSGAARALGLAQPSVTAHLQTLESRVGERLFERHARGVVPTPRADDLAARLQVPFDALAHEVLRATGREPTTPVALGGPAEFLAEVAAPALAALVRDGQPVRLVPGLTEDLLADVRSGHLDMVVSTRRPQGRTLSAVPLADEEFVLVGAADGPLRRVEDADAAAGAPLIAYAPDVPILRRYWRHVFGARLTAAPAMTVSDLRAIRAAVAAGAGISVLPRYLVQAMLDAGELVELLTTDDPPINTTFLVTRPNPSAAVARISEVLLRATLAWR